MASLSATLHRAIGPVLSELVLEPELDETGPIASAHIRVVPNRVEACPFEVDVVDGADTYSFDFGRHSVLEVLARGFVSEHDAELELSAMISAVIEGHVSETLWVIGDDDYVSRSEGRLRLGDAEVVTRHRSSRGRFRRTRKVEKRYRSYTG